MNIKPNDKAVTAYYKALEAYEHQGMRHEMAVRQAFATLLDTLARQMQWTLITEYPLKNRKRIDGALIHNTTKIVRGYWEAKDSRDNVDNEIKKKAAIGYPLSNTIFENTQRGILYQNDQRVLDVDLREPTNLSKLLTLFFTSTPQFEGFDTTVAAFEERIPELAAALKEIIEQEHGKNKAFIAALNSFVTLCQQSLNPNISMDAIKEMLVQHLLTERLFRTVFNNPDFIYRNVIAAEIEKVIRALTSRSFSRHDFLKELDYFYTAIEDLAATITSYGEKQAFLNTVYERFFQGFSQKQADTHGIVYTPQEIVDFMCASVDAVLHEEFGLSLSSEGVCILDPCVGTGNFMVNIINRLSRSTLQHKYKHELFCNEVMLLPYYITSLNIEHAYLEKMKEYLPFPGICFTDTLDLAEERQLSFFTEENTERVQRQKDAPITVIIGNPPYNVGQVNENDNNKNRTYTEVDQRIRETYTKDSTASNRNALSDMYVKFFRWATDRLHGRDGIVCLVTNNGFLDGIAFDGFRKHLAHDFTHVYVLNLGGNARRGKGGNVFGIRVGVSIAILVRKASSDDHGIYYHSVPDLWKPTQKLAFLSDAGDKHNVAWETLQPDAKHSWLTDDLVDNYDTFLALGTREAKSEQKRDVQTIFKCYSRGIATSRDTWAYNFNRNIIEANIERFITTFNEEADRWTRYGSKATDIDMFLRYDDTKIKWSETLKQHIQRNTMHEFDSNNIRWSLYRPFCKKYLYFDRFIIERVYQYPQILPTPTTETENVVICVAGIGDRKGFGCLATNNIPNLDLAFEKTQCFPYYTYDDDGSNRRENITDWALRQFSEQYGDTVTKWDIFYYTYALLHHPGYRERYAANLRRELPRIPMIGDAETFVTLATIGKQLANLHINYETAPEYPLHRIEDDEADWTWRVERMKLTKDKTAVIVNDVITLANIPSQCFEYRLGNRSALEWVIDQYQVKTDARSGITSDPNREDEPEYIVRLVGRVVHVSIETVTLVQKIAAIALGTE